MDITIELEPQVAAIVKELAAQTDRSPEWIIAKAIENYVDANQGSPEPTALPHGTATKSP